MANAPRRRDFLIIVKFAQNRARRLAELLKTVQIKRKERATFKGILEVDEVGRA